ncbi:MAG: hypothetical protein R8G66_34145 [Cytophagales bacterium]|nr:hypothetical protein [Cytophagales bacterium]
MTIGPSAEAPDSVNNIGEAAHITAAAPGGPRYDATLTAEQRKDISNGIWLCGTHARMIDRDVVTWTVAHLQEVKRRHEEIVLETIGIPQERHSFKATIKKQSSSITPKEFAYLTVGEMAKHYRSILSPIIQDKDLSDLSKLGVLLCGSPIGDHQPANYETPWTVFVNSDWLEWYQRGESKGFKSAPEVPEEQIYGRIPGWPDSFDEFLEAIVLTNSIFKWHRHPQGYLILAQ